MMNYAARNAILPQVTSFALALGFVVSGQILIEYTFSYPGVGYDPGGPGKAPTASPQSNVAVWGSPIALKASAGEALTRQGATSAAGDMGGETHDGGSCSSS